MMSGLFGAGTTSTWGMLPWMTADRWILAGVPEFSVVRDAGQRFKVITITLTETILVNTTLLTTITTTVTIGKTVIETIGMTKLKPVSIRFNYNFDYKCKYDYSPLLGVRSGQGVSTSRPSKQTRHGSSGDSMYSIAGKGEGLHKYGMTPIYHDPCCRNSPKGAPDFGSLQVHLGLMPRRCLRAGHAP